MKKLVVLFCRIAAIVFLLILVQGCNKESFVKTEAVNLDCTELSLNVGDIYALTAEVFPDNATDRQVVWTSSDESVVTVDGSGNVEAISPGEAVVTAACGGKSADCRVTVSEEVIHVREVSLAEETLSLEAGSSVSLEVEIVPENATDKSVVWTSSDETVAVVDGEGNVTAIKEGEAVIEVRSNDGGIADECVVTVIPAPVPVESVTISDGSLELRVGEVRTLSVTVLPENATDKTVRWSSSDENCAIVDGEGTVSALGEGTAVITVTSDDGGFSDECSVTVLPAGTVWARSNIVWVEDESYPDGGYLTFAVNESDNETIPSNVGGVFFAWGSLVAISAGGNAYDESCIVFDPTGNEGGYAWGSIPSLSGESAAPFDNNAASDDDFASYNGGTGFDESAGKGDICRYISSKGWVEGNWRLPTAEEFSDLIADGSVVWDGSTWANVSVSGEGEENYGFYPFASGYFFGQGAVAGDNIANPQYGVSIPVASYRAVWGGGQTTAGNYGSYWTGSSSATTDGWGVDISSLGANIVNSSRQYGFVVRCVRN